MAPTDKLPEPQAGGSYIRNDDGSITPVPGSQTSPADGRATRAPDAAQAPADTTPQAPAAGPDHSLE